MGLLALGFMIWMLNFGTIFSHEPDSEMVLNHDLMVLLALIDSGMHAAPILLYIQFDPGCNNLVILNF